MNICKIFAFTLCLSASFLTHAQHITQSEADALLQGLPFSSFSVKVPSFPDNTFNIVDDGAVGDGVTKNTEAINSTIAKCAKSGGGKVVIPAGLWLTGPITMQSNVNLFLAEGAIVIFSSNLADYPFEAKDKAVLPDLINGSGLNNVAITGSGVFNGNGLDWRPVKKEKLNEKEWNKFVKSGGELSKDKKIWSPRIGFFAGDSLNAVRNGKFEAGDLEKIKPSLRPYMLSIRKSKNVLIEGITLINAPKFAMYMNDIDGLILHEVSALNEPWAQNGDGLDVSASKNVLIYKCFVNTGDDGICMKSANSKDGEYRMENIVVRDCKVLRAHGGFVIGSNTDGNMRNIYVENCSFIGANIGLRFKSGNDRGGKVTHIFCENIYMKDILTDAILFDVSYEDKAVSVASSMKKEQEKIPDFDGFYFKNIFVDNAKSACRISAMDNSVVRNLTLKNSVMNTTEGFVADCAEGIVIDNVNIINSDRATYRLLKTSNFTLKNCDHIAGIENVSFSLINAKTKNITIESAKIKRENINIASNVNAEEVKITTPSK